jgi:hypothetical protein
MGVVRALAAIVRFIGRELWLALVATIGFSVVAKEAASRRAPARRARLGRLGHGMPPTSPPEAF